MKYITSILLLLCTSCVTINSSKDNVSHKKPNKPSVVKPYIIKKTPNGEVHIFKPNIIKPTIKTRQKK